MFTMISASGRSGTRLAMSASVLRRVLAGASLFTILVTSASGSAAPPADPRVVDVIARRFEFEPSMITVSVGEPVRLMVRSEDGLHGFEIKKFKVNKDIP